MDSSSIISQKKYNLKILRLFIHNNSMIQLIRYLASICKREPAQAPNNCTYYTRYNLAQMSGNKFGALLQPEPDWGLHPSCNVLFRARPINLPGLLHPHKGHDQLTFLVYCTPLKHYGQVILTILVYCTPLLRHNGHVLSRSSKHSSQYRPPQLSDSHALTRSLHRSPHTRHRCAPLQQRRHRAPHAFPFRL